MTLLESLTTEASTREIRVIHDSVYIGLSCRHRSALGVLFLRMATSLGFIRA